ncbi:hypothetical protein OROGR_000711 [Orobanche gracilis]
MPSLKLKYKAAGVTPSSQLNVTQRQDFYNQMKDAVWKITVEYDADKTLKTYNGVCTNNKRDWSVIVTVWLGALKGDVIRVYSPDGTSQVMNLAESVLQDRRFGLSILFVDKKSNKDKAKYVRCISSNIDVGTSLYSVVHGPHQGPPMFFMGKSVYPFYAYTDTRSNLNRTRFNLLEYDNLIEEEKIILRLLNWLDNDVSLIQVEDLECANAHENPENVYMGFQTGLGSPVFNANGRLLGIVAAQLDSWNIVIPSHYISKVGEN